MTQAAAAGFVILWLMAIGWQGNNAWRAWRKMQQAQRRYREIHNASNTR